MLLPRQVVEQSHPGTTESYRRWCEDAIAADVKEAVCRVSDLPFDAAETAGSERMQQSRPAYAAPGLRIGTLPQHETSGTLCGGSFRRNPAAGGARAGSRSPWSPALLPGASISLARQPSPAPRLTRASHGMNDVGCGRRRVGRRGSLAVPQGDSVDLGVKTPEGVPARAR